MFLSCCEAGLWLWQRIKTALWQGPCSSRSCPFPTIKPQASSFRPEEIPTLLPISLPRLKYLSQRAQMFNLWKHLNIILEKAMTLCYKLCRARELALLLSDFCQHFAQKQANAGE